MKIQKFSAFIILILLTIGITACRAEPENQNKDKLIGVLVTSENLPVNDKGVFYLTKTDDKENPFQLDSISGAYRFVYRSEDTQAQDSTIEIHGNDAAYDLHCEFIQGDNEERVEIKGSVHVSTGEAPRVYSFHPIFQDQAGKVYVKQGNQASANLYEEGSSYSTELSGRVSAEQNGKKVNQKTIINISVTVMNPPQTVSILQMNSANECIEKTDYAPDEIPDEITPHPQTAYFIVESTVKTKEGEAKKRELFDEKTECLNSYQELKNNFCVQNQTHILWSEPNP